MKKQNQFKLIWLIPVVIIAATAVTVVIFGLGSKGASGTPGYKVELDFNSPPTVSCNEDEDWCCADSRHPTLKWDYDDEDDPQESYWIQIDVEGSSDFIPPLKLDTGEVFSDGFEYTVKVADMVVQLPVDDLNWNTTYFWQIKVKDNQGRWSNWCSPSCSLDTPSHAYPDPWFEWSPKPSIALEPVEFTDKTSFGEGSTDQEWSWDFSHDPGADPLFSCCSLQNPTATPSVQGDWKVILTVTDDAGTCSETITVGVAKPLPEWEEVEPKTK